MDRNTLLAFFLIALVLLFTPKYMEIFGPPQTAKENLTTQNTGESQADTLALLNTGAMVNNKTPETTFLKDRENEHIVKTVEMDLYTVKVSSVNGGSIQEFLLKEFLAPDSQEVNTIARNSKSNLLIELQDLNGDPINLGGNWVLVEEPTWSKPGSEQILKYSLEVFLTKRLTNPWCLYQKHILLKYSLIFLK